MCTETEGLGRLLVTHSSENPIEPIAYIARSLIKFERCRRSNKEQCTSFDIHVYITEGLGRLLVTHSSENPIEPIAYISRCLIEFERCRRSNK